MADPTVDLGTKIIFVPQSFLTYTGGTNYTLDTIAFKIALRDLEDNDIGITALPMLNYNTAVTLGGIQYAPIVEIINGYTITFESTGTPYAVTLVGSNNNILDVTNLTDVAIRSSNSAGLVQTVEIQHSSFNNEITVDELNGTPGTLYPIGTTRVPTKYIVDAVLLASTRGINTLKILGDATLVTGDNVSELLILGSNAARTYIDIETGANTYNTEFREATITGFLDGNTIIRNCYVFDLEYVNGFLFSTELAGYINLGGNSTAHIMDCFADINSVTIDMGGTGQSLNLLNFSGDVIITNKTGNDKIEIHLNSGEITLDPTVTNVSNIHIAGIGSLVNLTGLEVDTNELISNSNISNRVWSNGKALTIPKYIGLK